MSVTLIHLYFHCGIQVKNKEAERKIIMREFLSDWKVHALCIVLTVIAELIGAKAVGPFGPIGFTLLPMLYALIMGALLAIFKVIKTDVDKNSYICT